jgi:hypothetical protein
MDNYLNNCFRERRYEELGDLIYKSIVLELLALNRLQQKNNEIEIVTLTGDKLRCMNQVSQLLECAVKNKNLLLLYQLFILSENITWKTVYCLNMEIQNFKSQAKQLCNVL